MQQGKHIQHCKQHSRCQSRPFAYIAHLSRSLRNPDPKSCRDSDGICMHRIAVEECGHANKTLLYTDSDGGRWKRMGSRVYDPLSWSAFFTAYSPSTINPHPLWRRRLYMAPLLVRHQYVGGSISRVHLDFFDGLNLNLHNPL